MKKEEKKDNKKIIDIKAERDKYLSGWKRERADFLNYKKAEEERIKKIRDYTKEDIILKTLFILDNIEIAENKIPRELKENEWVKGLLQIKTQILDFLRAENIEQIESIGKKFNPDFHEAIEQAEVENEESGIVIEEIQKGYILNNKVIRPAKVKVVK